MNYFDLSEWSFMILISVTLLTTFIILEVYHRIKLGRIEINQSSLLNRVKSSSKKIPTILTGAEIEEIRKYEKYSALMDDINQIGQYGKYSA